MSLLLGKLGLKGPLGFGWDLAKFAAGVPAYLVTGATPDFAYRAMVGLHCATSGYSNDLLSLLISAARPQYRMTERNGVLGELDDADLQAVDADLKAQGYHVFQAKLPDAVCDRLVQIALTTRCAVRAMDATAAQTELVLYDRGSPLGVRYDFREADLINHPDVQNLMSDPSILAVAQTYLGTAPILDIVAMWWHTAFAKQPDKQAAQYYHFDMDRVKWLKFFFYLTDVTPTSGPHCFVAGSHRRGGTPRALLQQGYTRLSDAEVRQHFSAADFVEFTGPRGTIIAEDTRGLHKGKHVERGDRLMFELEFTNSLLGGKLPDDRLRLPLSARLSASIAQYPAIYRLFLPPQKRRSDV